MHKKAAVKEAYLVFVFVHVYEISLRLSTAVALQMSFFCLADFGSAALLAPANSFVGTPYW